jgi:acyl-CoA reductase-like NAD-dependent aldehyde dehydrogenase
VPVLVDATADLAKAARRIVDSKSFDNSVLCTSESVLIVTEQAATALLRHLKQAGAYLLAPDERDRVAAMLFPGGRFDIRFVGKDASWIAAEAGLRVPNRTRVLLAPFDLVVPEEPLAHEKLCPVLGLVRVPSARRGIDAARAVLRLSGRGHSAAIHSTDPQVIMEYGAAVEVLRVAVNVGNSLGSAGLETNLAPTMTIGTGFFGRSSVGENLHPSHLVQWTRLAYNRDPAEPFVDIFQRQLHARRIVSQLHPTDKHENASQTSNRDPDPLRPDYVPRGGSANVPGVSHYLISSSNGCP